MAFSEVRNAVQVGNDVVHRLEFISDHETKAALIGLWVIQALAFVGLIVGLTLKKTKVGISAYTWQDKWSDHITQQCS